MAHDAGGHQCLLLTVQQPDRLPRRHSPEALLHSILPHVSLCSHREIIMFVETDVENVLFEFVDSEKIMICNISV